MVEKWKRGDVEVPVVEVEGAICTYSVRVPRDERSIDRSDRGRGVFSPGNENRKQTIRRVEEWKGKGGYLGVVVVRIFVTDELVSCLTNPLESRFLSKDRSGGSHINQGQMS